MNPADRAQHMNLAITEVTICTAQLSESYSGDNPRAKGIYLAKDAPDIAEHKVSIRLPYNILVDRVLGAWYQPIEGLDQLNGFKIIDVSDAQQDPFNADYMQVMLKLSSLWSGIKQAKIRIFVMYNGYIPVKSR